MNEEMNEASAVNLDEAIKEVEMLLIRRRLAGAVLVTDGIQGRLMQQLPAPWNSLALHPTEGLTMRRDDTARKMAGSVMALGVMFSMAKALAGELFGHADAARKELGGVQAVVEILNEGTQESREEIREIIAGNAEPEPEARARRCRKCGTTQAVADDRLCIGCRDKEA